LDLVSERPEVQQDRLVDNALRMREFDFQAVARPLLLHGSRLKGIAALTNNDNATNNDIKVILIRIILKSSS
jgi:hypothetical protein